MIPNTINIYIFINRFYKSVRVYIICALERSRNLIRNTNRRNENQLKQMPNSIGTYNNTPFGVGT